MVLVPMGEAAQKRKEIYTYQAPWLIYGMNWSVRADQRFRLAIGSFEEEYNNSVRIVQLDEETHQFVDNGGFEHPYPTTKIMWMPDQTGNRRDLLATTGDYLRLWNVMDNKSVRLEALLNNVRTKKQGGGEGGGARQDARAACRAKAVLMLPATESLRRASSPCAGLVALCGGVLSLFSHFSHSRYVPPLPRPVCALRTRTPSSARR